MCTLFPLSRLLNHTVMEATKASEQKKQTTENLQESDMGFPADTHRRIITYYT